MNRKSIAAGLVLAVSFSATALASADAAPSHRAQSSARAGAFTVTASVNHTEPLQGSKVKIKGSVKPAAPGAKVTLQLRYLDQKKWKNVATDTLSAQSKFKFKDKVGTVRTRKYRVVKAASANRAAGHSKDLRVTVFGWRDLASTQPATSIGFSSTSAVTMNAISYPNSLRSFNAYPPGTASSIGYNLNRDCKLFRGVAGLEDSSPEGGSAQIQMSTDGTVRYTGAFALTQAAPVAFDVSTVFRLTITATLNNAVAAVGTPKALCSF